MNIYFGGSSPGCFFVCSRSWFDNEYGHRLLSHGAWDDDHIRRCGARRAGDWGNRRTLAGQAYTLDKELSKEVLVSTTNYDTIFARFEVQTNDAPRRNKRYSNFGSVRLFPCSYLLRLMSELMVQHGELFSSWVGIQ